MRDIVHPHPEQPAWQLPNWIVGTPDTSRSVLAGRAARQPSGRQGTRRLARRMERHHLAARNGRSQLRLKRLARQVVERSRRVTGEADHRSGFDASRTETLRSRENGAAAVGQRVALLVRAFRRTGNVTFLVEARHALTACEQDILDGGIASPIGEHGICFEEVAQYPAAHPLTGFVHALLGLHDYLTVSCEDELLTLEQRGHEGLHMLMPAYDTGYWTRSDLLERRLATARQHTHHVAVIKALAEVTGCDTCAAVAQRWNGYAGAATCRARRMVASWMADSRRSLLSRIRPMLFPSARAQEQMIGGVGRICVPITAFPVTGGMRSVLTGITRAMAGDWEVEYLTSHVGPHREGLIVQNFGGSLAGYWQFPNVWLYVFAGCRKLISLLRTRRYHVIMPQDGVYTGAFAAIAGHLAGVRVVCFDHGNVTFPYSEAYQAEQEDVLAAQPPLKRLLMRVRLALYAPSLRLLTRIAVHHADALLPAGDDVADVLIGRLGVHPSRIVRYPFLIDTERFAPIGVAARRQLRTEYGIAEDAILIAMVNRLAPEKGMELALQGLHLALGTLAPEVRRRVQMVIAGDGPLRSQVEADIRLLRLEGICTLWGEAEPQLVATLLGISDIFLYTSTRGITPVSLLEAMSAGCGIVASTCPRSVASYLAEGRGMAISPGDGSTVGDALALAVRDLPHCRAMGRLAREYISAHHSADALRRALLRSTYWSPTQPHHPARPAAVSAPSPTSGA